MNCRTLLALSLVAALACAGASTDADPTATEAEPVRPMEPVEQTDKLTEGPADPSALESAEWTLVEIDGDRSVADEASITWKLDGENLSGRSGCNLYQSTVATSGARVVMGVVASTKRACPPPVMELESRFLGALGGVNGWRIDGDRLHLDYETEDGETGTLVFVNR